MTYLSLLRARWNSMNNFARVAAVVGLLLCWPLLALVVIFGYIYGCFECALDLLKP